MARLIQYNEQTAETWEAPEPEALLAHLDERKVNWLDLSTENGNLEPVARFTCLHALTIEDILHHRHLPKCESFENYVFFSLKMLQVDKANGELAVEHVSIVLGAHWVLTLQEEEENDVFDALRRRIEQSLGRVRMMGPDYLFCQLLKAVVEHYKLTLEHYREQIDALEDQVLDRPQENMVQEIVDFRKQINRIRKYTSPLREEISRLMIDGHPLIHKQQRAYLRDIQDNLNDLTLTFEQFREMLKDLSELYLSQLSHSMNQVMKTLTVVTTLFIPLTFVAGVYGMNFAHMPELSWKWGYASVLVLMALTGAGMWMWMKRKKWF